MAKFTRYIAPGGQGIAEHPSGLLYRREEVDPVIEALEARVAAADKLADQAQMVKDFRYDPNIGVQLNFLEVALAAYQATKEGE